MFLDFQDCIMSSGPLSKQATKFFSPDRLSTFFNTVRNIDFRVGAGYLGDGSPSVGSRRKAPGVPGDFAA